MNKLLESAGIALEAIWAAKLRSLMTVLGNIVAVTSIIAVVSLIQGLNASVQDAILNQAGADSFSVQQFPVTFSDEEFEKVRYNPRITLADARAIRRYSALVSAVMLESRGSGQVAYRDKIDRQRRHPGRHVGVRQLLDLQRRARPADEPDRSRAVAAGGRRRLGCRRSAVRQRPIRSRKTIQIEGMHFRVVGVSAEARRRFSASRRTPSRSSRSGSSSRSSGRGGSCR